MLEDVTVSSMHDRLRGRLIVSCQAPAGSPMNRPAIIAAFARAAELGGAGGVRVGGPEDIRAARRAVRVPIIGLVKRRTSDSPVYITPTMADALAVVEAGADLVAVDATARARPEGQSMAEIIKQLSVMGIATVADVDDLRAALAAVAAGADFIATTLSGYTGPGRISGPDIELVAQVSRSTRIPVIAEGRYREPFHIRAAFEAGAHTVVVGDAITNPIALTRRLVDAIPHSPNPEANDGRDRLTEAL